MQKYCIIPAICSATIVATYTIYATIKTIKNKVYTKNNINDGEIKIEIDKMDNGLTNSKILETWQMENTCRNIRYLQEVMQNK